jgi:hypothetical protein
MDGDCKLSNYKLNQLDMKNIKNSFKALFLMSILYYSCQAEELYDKSSGNSKKDEQYDVTKYGAVNSKTELSTEAIQKAINEASAAGGGRVYVPEGYYLISPIQLKSKVELYLEKGAVLLGTTDRTLYNIPSSPLDLFAAGERGLIWASGASDIAIKGEGGIDGQGEAVAYNTGVLIAQGVLYDVDAAAITARIEAGKKDFLDERPRPNEYNRPMLIALYDCNNVELSGVKITNAAMWVTVLFRCDDIILKNLTVSSRSFWNNDGIDIVDCHNALIDNCNVNAADDGICLKSHDPRGCNNITITNSTICSSASAIKFGTASFGGFANVVIDNIKVKDTYRSAVAIEAVDGGAVSNIKVSNIIAENTSNALFMVVGERSGSASMSDVTIENLSCHIPAGKPDSMYDKYVVKGHYTSRYSILPALITAMPRSPIQNVKLKNISITTAAGAETANVRYDQIPTIMDGKYNKYPEFDMFGELPAWGLLCRNIEGLELENISLTAEKKDCRHPVIISETKEININGLNVSNEEKAPLLFFRSDSPSSITGINSPGNTTGDDYLEYESNQTVSYPGFTIQDGILTAYSGEGGDVTIPDPVRTIAPAVFKDNTAITTMNLNKVTDIGNSAFNNCSNLTEVIFGDTKSIGDWAFAGCTSLERIDLTKVTSLGKQVFEGCTGLSEATAAELTSLGEKIFFQCSALQTVNMPKVESIGNNCFEKCTVLNTVNLPKLTNVSMNGFFECSNLQSISNSPLIAYIGSSGFGKSGLTAVELNALVSTDRYTFNECKSLRTAIIGAEVIYARMFWLDTALEEVNFPNATHIGATVSNNVGGVFNGCTKLETVNMPKAEILEPDLFSNCTALTSIALPALKEIKSGVFNGCSALTTIDLHSATGLTTVATNAVPDRAGITIYVANASIAAKFTGTKYTVTIGAPTP